MAKILEDKVVITFSKIVKDGASDEATLIDTDIKAALEQVAQELVGDQIVVEVL